MRELVPTMCDHEPAKRPALLEVLSALQKRKVEIRQSSWMRLTTLAGLPGSFLTTTPRDNAS